MKKHTKCVLVAAACILLTGCPKATSVTGTVTTGLGYAVQYIAVGTTLSPSLTYNVFAGASITVTYDNGKTCTFTGETSFIPGNDGSVCQQQDNNDNKKQDKKDDRQDQQQDQQQDKQQDQQQDKQQDQQQDNTNQPQDSTQSSQQDSSTQGNTNQPSTQTGGGGGGSGSYAQDLSFKPSFTGPTWQIVQTTLSVIGGAAVAKEVHDQTNGSDKPDEPISK